MNILFHYFLCPSSRFTRIILIEKKIDFDLFIENFSDPTEDYLFKNPAGFFPVLNTSFNENEPIVCHPQEAIDCFMRTKMDVLVLENWVFTRD